MKKLLRIVVIALVIIILQQFRSSDQTGLQQVAQNQQIATVDFVIDGDTFVLDGGQRVRLIGIDTPERGEDLYEEATKALETLIEDKEVELVSDIENTDQYDRLLRYVYVNGVFVNKELVNQGLADAKSYRPNTSLQQELFEAEEQAKQNNLGLWK